MPGDEAPAARRIDRLLRDARARLSGDEAAIEVEQLLCAVLGRSRAWLFAHADEAIDAAQCSRFDALLEERAGGTPIAHLLGRRGFWTLDLDVSAATLIPRPETELLVEAALQRMPTDRALRVADLGTGSGAIALALASERANAQVVAVDISTAALEVAHGNARRLSLANVEFCHGSWLSPLAGLTFDLIVSNPPYIADDDPHLQQGDLRFEPRNALASGKDGLDAIREIVGGTPGHLQAGGLLLLEHGWEQGAAVRALLAAAGFVDVESLRDLEQRERVSLGRWPPQS